MSLIRFLGILLTDYPRTLIPGQLREQRRKADVMLRFITRLSSYVDVAIATRTAVALRDSWRIDTSLYHQTYLMMTAAFISARGDCLVKWSNSGCGKDLDECTALIRAYTAMMEDLG